MKITEASSVKSSNQPVAAARSFGIAATAVFFVILMLNAISY